MTVGLSESGPIATKHCRRPGPGAIAWIVLAKRTEADFQEWRDHRDSTAQNYALWDAGKRSPPLEWEPGKPCSIWMKCQCGAIFNSHRLDDTVVHVPHLTKAKQAG
jgi:hypothetical protein